MDAMYIYNDGVNTDVNIDINIDTNVSQKVDIDTVRFFFKPGKVANPCSWSARQEKGKFPCPRLLPMTLCCVCLSVWSALSAEYGSTRAWLPILLVMG